MYRAPHMLNRVLTTVAGRAAPGLTEGALDFLRFGIKQVRACVFAGSFFVLLFLSHHVTFGLHRYDFLFLSAVALQVVLLVTRVETFDEFKTIVVFHLLGFVLEAFKTHPSIGSWHYPEPGIFKVLGVPLYSGFMYAAIGSYMAQSWRLLKLRLSGYPRIGLAATLCAAIYLNFFTHHFTYDLRYVLMVAVVVLFWRTRVHFTVSRREYWIPMVSAFVLIAFFIWVAENMATLLGAWKYPDQLITWTTVSLHKIGSWSLLVIVSLILVAELKRVKERLEHAGG